MALEIIAVSKGRPIGVQGRNEEGEKARQRELQY